MLSVYQMNKALSFPSNSALNLLKYFSENLLEEEVCDISIHMYTWLYYSSQLCTYKALFVHSCITVGQYFNIVATFTILQSTIPILQVIFNARIIIILLQMCFCYLLYCTCVCALVLFVYNTGISTVVSYSYI